MKRSSIGMVSLLLLTIMLSCIKKPEEKDTGVVLAQLKADLNVTENYIRTQEAPAGNFVADAVVAGLKAYGHDVDIALINAGSLRYNAQTRPLAIYPTGAFTSDMLDELLPFSENKLIIMEISGLQLREIIERSLAQLPLDKGSFMQVSQGMKIQADLSKQPQVLDETVTPPVIQTPGQRVVSISINETPISDVELYRVAVADYIAAGNDGYVTCYNVSELQKWNTQKSQTNLVREQVIIQSVIDPKTEGRIQF